MTTTISAAGVPAAHFDARNEAGHSPGVSWAAILAGAAGAAALSLILLVLGAGLGFAAMSPWSSSGASATAIGASTIVWFIFVSVVASAVGGYLAGRLRGRWSGVHGDEVYFRDTAHGFLAWAIASLATAAFLASAVTGIVSGAGRAAGELAKGAASAVASAAPAAPGEGSNSPISYFVDSLFRSETAQPVDGNDGQARSEAIRIFANDMRTGSMGSADVRYLGQVVARKTGLAPADAEKRVADVFTQTSTAITNAQNAAKQAADEARRAAAYAALWTFVALLAGAFCASLAALSGGRQRDDLR